MGMNMLKMKVIVFRRDGIIRQNKIWFYGDTQLEVVSFYKYVGLFLHQHSMVLTNWIVIQTRIESNNMIFLGCQRNFGLFSPNDIFKSFDSMVTTILTYGAEIWGYEYRKTVHSVKDTVVLVECGRLR